MWAMMQKLRIVVMEPYERKIRPAVCTDGFAETEHIIQKDTILSPDMQPPVCASAERFVYL